ncbi:thermonuclease family protein [Alkalicoccus urumqiensis]|uniref:TNase-like domain-containing protein n=1 Tax=Alkalicoccus urumqiensis TaxID=1548213 RepID=A0A2P6MFH8_ALKUR|nr:thermonuclease family protein [Alkalicoccus urumqiensis]PRO65046.1 hypothetical protein C6I21_11405 [Alkalicoccus urumqiensis]
MNGRIILAAVILTGCQSGEEEKRSYEPPFELNTYEERMEQEEVRTAVVTHIVDGDTFDAVIEGSGEERIRPYMIDAPEICHAHDPPSCKPESWGDEASRFAEETLLGETVYLEPDETPVDPYGRTLAYVYLEDGTMYQELLLALGFAEMNVYPPDDRYERELNEVEQKAKELKIGMWE